MFVSVLSSLAIVIGLIFASFWFYNKAAPKMSGALPKQVVQCPLVAHPWHHVNTLVLLRLGSKLVLVSNLHGEVRTISEIYRSVGSRSPGWFVRVGAARQYLGIVPFGYCTTWGGTGNESRHSMRDWSGGSL